jgi:hypothetical protein
MKNRDHPLYAAFAGMKDRCYNHRHRSYHRYGGRGITVCDRWLVRGQGFWNFIEDMGNRPNGCSLDRIDNDGNYCPENCKWSTRKEQTSNADLATGERHGSAKMTTAKARRAKQLIADGVKLKEIAAELGVARQTISDIKFERTWRGA